MQQPTEHTACRLEMRINRRVGRGHHRNGPFNTCHLDEGEWTTLAPGVECKAAHSCPSHDTFLWRLAPNTSLPAHQHDSDEESILISGDIWLDGEYCEPGAVHFAPQGSVHTRIFTPQGALLVVKHYK